MSNGYDWRIGEPPPLLGEHSVAKHEIFEQYLGIYIERLRGRLETRGGVDGRVPM
jgi:hypothetical protein